MTREKYWSVPCKSRCREVANVCIYIVKDKRVKPQQQLVSDLPESPSAVFDPPFVHTGVDYFGPITIKRGKQARASTGLDKRYGVVFICLTYRAIHLELAGDLSTDCIVMALQRFASRRGNRRSMWSDSGQNFVGTNRELTILLKGSNQTAITNNLSIWNIQWHFIPPSISWMGGA